MLLNYYLIGSTTVQSELDFMTTDFREKNERKKNILKLFYVTQNIIIYTFDIIKQEDIKYKHAIKFVFFFLNDNALKRTEQ